MHRHVGRTADHTAGERVGSEGRDHVPRVSRAFAPPLRRKHVLIQARQQPATGRIDADVVRKPSADRVLRDVNVGVEQWWQDQSRCSRHLRGDETEPLRHLLPRPHVHDPPAVVPRQRAIGPVLHARGR